MSDNIESILQEKRVFNPPQGFADRAAVRSMAEYQKLYKLAKKTQLVFGQS